MIIKRFFYKVKRWLNSHIDNLFWGSIGRKSKVIHPMRILGKKHIYLGDNVHILNNARMEAVRYFGNKELNGTLKIGNGTSIEQNCHIIAADELVIGEDCMFSADVYISDCEHQYARGKRIAEQELIIKKTKIGNGVFIGIGAKIMLGVKLGDNCVIGANAVVTHDVPEGMIVAGVPARIIGENV